jgi:hypothetical protein
VEEPFTIVERIGKNVVIERLPLRPPVVTPAPLAEKQYLPAGVPELGIAGGCEEH